MELQSVSYKDDQWVLASRWAQVAYYGLPKESKKHVVVSGKQRIVGVDGVQSPEEYNNYAELSLFTDHPQKIKLVETHVNKTKVMPWFHLMVRRRPSWEHLQQNDMCATQICNNVVTYWLTRTFM